MTYTVDTAGISKAFGQPVALDQVQPTVEQGTMCALLGPNRAGQTTLVTILGTLVRPDARAVCVAGQNFIAEPDRVSSGRRLARITRSDTATIRAPR